MFEKNLIVCGRLENVSGLAMKIVRLRLEGSRTLGQSQSVTWKWGKVREGGLVFL